MTRLFRASLALAAMMAADPALAQPTNLVVRALAKDAKFIGDSMGGVEITLTDARTGKRLARGLTAGGTGDTKRLIVEPRVRGQALSTPEAARFEAILDITQPLLVHAEARGPVGTPGAAIRVSSEMWLLPGRDVGGDGWVIELPGLVVEPAVEPTTGGLRVTAKVTLMCGCPIEPAGHWDANQYDIRAALLPGDAARLTYAGKPSTFSGVVTAPRPGRYRLRVTAHNAQTGNTGVSETTVTVPKPPR